MSSLAYVPPGLFMVLGALLVPFWGNARNAYMLLYPSWAFLVLCKPKRERTGSFCCLGRHYPRSALMDPVSFWLHLSHCCNRQHHFCISHQRHSATSRGLVYAGSAIGGLARSNYTRLPGRHGNIFSLFDLGRKIRRHLNLAEIFGYTDFLRGLTIGSVMHFKHRLSCLR